MGENESKVWKQRGRSGGEESMRESWVGGGDSAGGETKGFERGKHKEMHVGVDLNFSKGKGDYHCTSG